MRERLWFALRKSPLLRRAYGLPVFCGPLRFASFLLVPSARQVRMEVQTGPGKGLVLDVNPRWEHPFLEGDYELEVQNLIERFCRVGVIFYDIGANFGYYSLLATRFGARAIAFEPDAANAENVLIHARLNGLGDRIWLEPTAVFSHTGQLLLRPAGKERPHGNAWVLTSDSSMTESVSVRCTTVDDYATSNPTPSVMKIDVEGAESEVLKGGQRTFQTVRPLLICEVHDAVNERFILPWLRERGYVTKWLEATQVYPRQLFAWPSERGSTECKVAC